MARIKKIHKLNVQAEGKSSPFLVDLARNLKEKEEKKIKAIEASFAFKRKKLIATIMDGAESKKKDIKSRASNAAYGFGGFFSRKQVGLRGIFSRKKRLFNGANIWNVFKLGFENYYDSFFSHKKYKKLSFYFLFNLFFKLNYFTGWIVIFLVRLVVLAPLFVYKRTSGFFVEKIADVIEELALRKELRLNRMGLLEDGLVSESVIGINPVESKKIKITKKSWRLPRDFKFLIRLASRLTPRLKLSFVRQVFIFSILLLIVIAPLKAFFHYQEFKIFKGRVLGVSTSAVFVMKNSSGNITELNFNKAVENFTNASNNFRAAQDQMREVNVVLDALARVVPTKDIKLASQADLFLRAGELTASVANRIGSSLELFDTNNLKIKDVLNILYNNLNSSNAEIVELGEILKEIDLDNLPDEYREKLSLFQKSSADISKLFVELTRPVDGTRKILGFDYDRRYLIVFQNNSEMRGSGGFVGSYALADFKNGEMINLEVPTGGSYDTEAGYSTRVAAPEPLQLVNPLWHFWDANWWPDWAMSAKKLMWFYEKSNGPTVDGVIAVTPNVMVDLLKIIGPLDLQEKYGKTITDANFWEVVQAIVEEKPDVLPGQATSTLLKVVEQKHEPKRIIGDMMNLIMAKVSKELSREDFLNILKIAYKNLNEKHIMAYFIDDELQKLISDFDWAGLMENTDGDYLMVANSNIAGAKSDKKIKEDISLSREVQADGSIINTLKIQRRHTAIRGDEFVGVRNVNWMRVYVPAGSELIEATGFSKPDGKFFEKPLESWKKDEDVLRGEGDFSVDSKSETKIYQELNKTVFANWSMVDPGEQILITIRYKLPFTLKKGESVESRNLIDKIINGGDVSNYAPLKLLVQKQPGSQGSGFVSSLSLPKNMQVAWQNSTAMNYENVLNIDRNWVLLLRIED